MFCPLFMDMEGFAQFKLKNSTDPEHQHFYQEFVDLKNMSETEWNNEAQKETTSIV